jgi:thiamine biosynthesis protein ThiC
MTQIEEARKGNITPSLKKVAENEDFFPETLVDLVSQGKLRMG